MALGRMWMSIGRCDHRRAGRGSGLDQMVAPSGVARSPLHRIGLRFFPDGRSILVGYSCEDLPLWRHAKISVRNTDTLEEEVVLWRKDLRWQTATMALAFAGWLAWLVGRHRRRRRGSIAQADQRFGQDQPKKQY